MEYDYIVVGAGLFGATFAYEANKLGKRVLVIERRPHIGGNVYTESIEGIQVHKYGAHIFHTNNRSVWEYITKFGEFNNFVNSPLANFKGKLYNLPFNMNTFYSIWGVRTPAEARAKIEKQQNEAGITDPKNLEEQAISLVGEDIYKYLIKGYTEKQWGRDCRELPASIIKRLPVRFTFDNNYFNAKWQGIPIDGYTKIIEKMLDSIDVRLNVDYFEDRYFFNKIANKIVYTGPIDAFFDYKYGVLEYRRVRFETEIIDEKNYQGVAVVNYTDKETPYTRIIEHKHFTFGNQNNTVISKEYPAEWKIGDEPYYPIEDNRNLDLFKRYFSDIDRKKFIFGGRLATYKYMDMDSVIDSALISAKENIR